MTEVRPSSSGSVPEGRPPGSGRIRPDALPPEETGSERIGPVATEAFERLSVWLGEPETGEEPERLATELLEESGAEEVWSALEVLHGFLDERLAEGDVELEECRSLRRRLTRLGRVLGGRRVDPEEEELRSLLGDVAHDLRSPLNSILFLIEGLHSGQLGPLTDRQRQQVGIVYSAATSLLNLVNGLVDWSRTVEEGIDCDQRFAVGETVEKIRQLARPIAEVQETDLRVEVDADGQYRGNASVLTRVALNLATNALEATAEGGSVTLRVEDREDGLRIAVEDGVDDRPKQLERLRRLFRPGAGRVVYSRDGDTHGLGLRISARLIHAVGGTTDVERLEEGAGKRVAVTLPFRLESQTAESRD